VPFWASGGLQSWLEGDLLEREDTLKSNEGLNPSDYLRVVECIYSDATARCSADVSDLRDLDTMRSRVKDQGLSFLTITLPQFCKDFERSLELGFIDSKLFQGFRKCRSIPSFLRGMISQIFNIETGRIIDDQDSFDSGDISNYIDAVRQICLAFKKFEIPCTPEREYKALQNFIEVERSFNDFQISAEDAVDFISVSSVLWDSCLRDIRVGELVPRHGPGQTSERIFGNSKFSWKYWHERLEPFFPLVDSAFPISIVESLDSAEELNSVTLLDRYHELPVRVCPVPKTLKGPRIIAIEPCCMQYAQQGIRDVLYDRIESNRFSTGHINFRDQSVNQRLALDSSKDGRLATIDLKDASDRVPRFLALSMFRSNPDLQGAIDACRSRYAVMPDGQIFGPLRKFASMGSALCFPIEAMYFYTICVVALLKENSLPVSSRNVFKVSRNVYVYGDDIIVPSTSAEIVLDYLAKYNCLVNTDKTFYRGNFRESCGVDAYRGSIVTPIYVNTPQPKNKQQASFCVSWVATANLFYKKGYLRTSHYLFTQVEKVLGVLPSVPETSPGLGRNFPWVPPKRKFNRNYQVLEERLWVPRPVYRTDRLEGYAAMQKCFLKLRDLKNLSVSRDVRHLERSAVYGGLALTLRWVPPTLGGSAS